MAGKSPAEAVNNFLEPLHKVIDCLTQAQLTVKGGYYPTTEDPHALTLGDGLPQRLSGATELYLVVKQFYYVIRVEDPDGLPWKVSTAEYNYNLRDSDNRILIAYHWHPAERYKVRTPHLHLGQGAKVGRQDLYRVHIPTGRIAIEDLARFAIKELGVAPRRDDWEEVLSRARKTYEDRRTWS